MLVKLEAVVSMHVAYQSRSKMPVVATYKVIVPRMTRGLPVPVIRGIFAIGTVWSRREESFCVIVDLFKVR